MTSTAVQSEKMHSVQKLKLMWPKRKKRKEHEMILQVQKTKVHTSTQVWTLQPLPGGSPSLDGFFDPVLRSMTRNRN